MKHVNPRTRDIQVSAELDTDVFGFFRDSEIEISTSSGLKHRQQREIRQRLASHGESLEIQSVHPGA